MEILLNTPFSIPIDVGFEDGNGNENFERVLVASEMEPAHIGYIDQGDRDNGTYEETDFWIIVQNSEPVLLKVTELTHSYGCVYGKNGHERHYSGQALPPIPLNLL